MGGTNFWDALRFVLEVLVRRQANHRSAVVVMTDGVDNSLPGVSIAGEGSQTPFAELLTLARNSEAVIYPIYLDTEQEAVKYHTPVSAYELARNQLAQLADASGSILYKAARLEDLRPSMNESSATWERSIALVISQRRVRGMANGITSK